MNVPQNIRGNGQLVDDNRPPSATGAGQYEDEGEISFVLERNPSASPTGNKLGLFSLALIMCVCCCSSFFAPVGSSTFIADGSSVSMGTGQVGSSLTSNHHGSAMSLQEATGTSAGSTTPEQVTTMVND